MWSAEHYICHSDYTVAMQKNTSIELPQQPSASLEMASVDEIRRNIAITTTQLIELTHCDDKLHYTVRRYNLHGIKNIEHNQHTQALAYFNQCERILQYAASCGKTIDRSLIIAILNNQALLYHKASDIDTAYNYLQAILYNLKMFLDIPQNCLLLSKLQKLATIHNGTTQAQVFIQQNFQEIKSLFERKQQIAIFYLRFSGLNSQRQMHSQSLHNARQSLRHMKQLCNMCYHYNRIASASNMDVKMLMKELSCINDDLAAEDINAVREELRRLCGGLVHNNQIYHQAYDYLTAENKQQIMETNVHSLFDLEPIFIADHILQNQNHNIDLCSSYSMQITKILYLMGAYFAIAVQTQEIEYPQQSDNSKIEEIGDISTKEKYSVTAEMAYLYSLIIGYKYLPKDVKLTNYLYSLYCDTYPSTFLTNQDSPIISEIYSPPTHPSPKNMQQNLNQLKQKYKNYIVQRQMDISDSVSRQECRLKDSKSVGNWQQQKKESKKLNELLKQDTNNLLPLPNQYLSEVQYIDSFEMANSPSATQNSVSIGMKTISSDDMYHNQGKQDRKGLTLKQITQCQSRMLEQTQKQSKMVGKFSANPTIPNDNLSNRKIKGREVSKSKSVKHIKSKSKQPKTKVSTKKNASIYTIPSVGAIQSVNTTGRKVISKSKSPSKNKNQMTTTSASQQKKVVKMDKKVPIMNSERIKYTHNINPLASVKNYQSIKFNKVKCPNTLDQRNNKITSVINDKNQKRQSKKSTSSKKMSSKSVSLPKSQNKQLGGTGNLKIYTSVGWNKTKKQ